MTAEPPLDASGDDHDVVSDIIGDTVTTINTAHGPVNSGSGTQVYAQSATFVVDERLRVSRVPGREHGPRLVSEEHLQRLETCFVAPDKYGSAREKLRNHSIVLVTGHRGIGRRTAAMMLLRQSGPDGARFRELPDGEPASPVLDRDTVEPGERLLLDLSDDSTALLSKLQQHLEAYRDTVRGHGGCLVVILPEHHEAVLRDEFGHLVVSLGRPAGHKVFTKHLRFAGIEIAANVLISNRTLWSHLKNDPMREIATLAALVRDARDADGNGEVTTWLDRAVTALGDSSGKVAAQFRNASDGRARAWLIAAALTERARAEVVFTAATSLLDRFDYPQEEHILEQPDLTARLEAIGVRVDASRRIRFEALAQDAAIRTYFWNNYPGVHLDLRDWVDTVLKSPQLTGEDRDRISTRFAEQCVRTDRTDDIFTLCRRWADQATSGKAIRTLQAATALEYTLTTEKSAQVCRQQFGTWAQQTTLPASLAQVLITLCTEVVAATHPDQALVRLRRLTRNQDRAVVAAAKDALLRLAADDNRFFRRLLGNITPHHDSVLSDSVMLDLFTGLTPPERLTDSSARSQSLIADSAVRRTLVSCWSAVMARSPRVEWAPAARRWLSAHAAGTGPVTLLKVLVAAGGGQPSRLSQLHAVVTDWVSSQSHPPESDLATRRRTAALVFHEIDVALGLDFTVETDEHELGR